MEIGNWQQKSSAIEAVIHKLPIIRNEILSLDESKKVFDRLFNDLVEYFVTVRSDFFDKYKNDLLNIEIKAWPLFK